jgi:hypothetical protein
MNKETELYDLNKVINEAIEKRNKARLEFKAGIQSTIATWLEVRGIKQKLYEEVQFAMNAEPAKLQREYTITVTIPYREDPDRPCFTSFVSGIKPENAIHGFHGSFPTIAEHITKSMITDHYISAVADVMFNGYKEEGRWIIRLVF